MKTKTIGKLPIFLLFTIFPSANKQRGEFKQSNVKGETQRGEIELKFRGKGVLNELIVICQFIVKL